MLSHAEVTPKHAKLVHIDPSVQSTVAHAPSDETTSAAVHTHGKRQIKIRTGLTVHSTVTAAQIQPDWMHTQRVADVQVGGKELYELVKRRKPTKRAKLDPDAKKDMEKDMEKEHEKVVHASRFQTVADDASSSDDDVPTMSERYFDNTSRSTKTSSNTLDSMPQLSHAEYQRLLRRPHAFSEFQNKHTVELQSLFDAHVGQFQSWKFELQRFNLCFHGTGSKRSLLNKFGEYCAKEMHPLMIVNGYLPSVSIKSIVQSMSDALLNGAVGRVADMLDKLRVFFESEETTFYLVIHSLDAPALRSTSVQSFLSTLATFRGVKLICSVDHRNVGLLWDSGVVERYRFLWHDVTTLQPFVKEMQFEDSGMVHGVQKRGGVLGAQHVLKSVSIQARKIFEILAKMQLKHESVSLARLLRVCTDEFVVSSNATFKSQVREFKDHNLFVTKPSSNGEQVSIPMKREELEKVLGFLAQ